MKKHQPQPRAASELSVVIIARNEEKNIRYCIESARQVSNDIIVVVDSGSTDDTARIAEGCDTRVYVRHWEGYSSQKNFGNQQARHDLILSLDADERVSAALAKSIRYSLKNYQPNTLFSINVLSNFEGRFIYHGGWYPDLHTRIFEKKATRWVHSEVHERLESDETARTIRLQGDILHYTAPDKIMFREKMKKYATLFAHDRFKKGINYSPFKKYFSSLFRFFKEYIVKMGFLDGRAGGNIAWENAVYTYLKYDYLEKLHRFYSLSPTHISIE